ncbi:molybdopterin-guanine dinucleotide biosynthesis protein B [Kroppenstedtia pulmonis]|uniref:Molybdopterin-guanine dinucleotide biosynthesis protein B n=1 Tax=Kroppenstedtia pulmonis TaxID=1380685 RepID=A0A7D4CVA3_9BACL|nr:molybdopterin-guanine dinucleotide biosynthesis protein B [Kroppenstedtia pulmonis]QKG84157.1 molybdopterin-guanine dinucleotide biosynthesis protein B [Kroppenstedtia pulmonis]
MKKYALPPVIQFVGYANSGKTTLICRVMDILTGKGLRVGTIKHHAHKLEVDQPGKDTWKHQQAGACLTSITGTNQTVIFHHTPLSLEQLLFYYQDMDLILVEGYKRAPYPKWVLIRNSAERTLAEELSHVQGVICPERLENMDIPQYTLEDASYIAEEISNTLSGTRD